MKSSGSGLIMKKYSGFYKGIALFIFVFNSVPPASFALVKDSGWTKEDLVGFQILTAATTKMAVFWVGAPCSLTEDYIRFRGTCCLHHQGDYQICFWTS
jgi:hypothetical protein